MNRLYIFLLVLFSSNYILSAQNNIELGFLPSININKSLPKDYSLNFKVESRQSLFKEDFNFEYLLTDISLAGAKKVAINTTVVVGYLMRFDGEEVKQRSIQQFSFVRRYTKFRMAHRIAADQTFSNDEDIEFRFRYRLSSEIPLEGDALNAREFFVKFNNEYLVSLQSNNYDFEVRGAAFLGYVITPKNKLELGLDYRLDSFIDNNFRNRFWIGLNFYQQL